MAKHHWSLALDDAVVDLAARGWRLEHSTTTQATVSRPVLWLPTRVHVLLLVVTLGLWGVVWAWMRSPRLRRTARLVTVDSVGAVRVTRVPSS